MVSKCINFVMWFAAIFLSCQSSTDLIERHVIPTFVFSWFVLLVWNCFHRNLDYGLMKRYKIICIVLIAKDWGGCCCYLLLFCCVWISSVVFQYSYVNTKYWVDYVYIYWVIASWSFVGQTSIFCWLPFYNFVVGGRNISPYSLGFYYFSQT